MRSAPSFLLPRAKQTVELCLSIVSKAKSQRACRVWWWYLASTLYPYWWWCNMIPRKNNRDKDPINDIPCSIWKSYSYETYTPDRISITNWISRIRCRSFVICSSPIISRNNLCLRRYKTTVSVAGDGFVATIVTVLMLSLDITVPSPKRVPCLMVPNFPWTYEMIV